MLSAIAHIICSDSDTGASADANPTDPVWSTRGRLTAGASESSEAGGLNAPGVAPALAGAAGKKESMVPDVVRFAFGVSTVAPESVCEPRASSNLMYANAWQTRTSRQAA